MNREYRQDNIIQRASSLRRSREMFSRSYQRTPHKTRRHSPTHYRIDKELDWPLRDLEQARRSWKV